MDIFEGQMSYNEVINCPLDELTDLINSKIKQLEEKMAAQKAEINKAQHRSSESIAGEKDMFDYNPMMR